MPDDPEAIEPSRFEHLFPPAEAAPRPDGGYRLPEPYASMDTSDPCFIAYGDGLIDRFDRERRERDHEVESAPDTAGPAYPIGRGRPPVEYRFRKGQSSNPRGRPRRRRGRRADSRALDFAHQPASRLLLKEAYRLVEVTEGDRTRRLPAIQAVYRSIAESAQGGHRLAQAMWVQLVQRTESAERETRMTYLREAIAYKQAWEQAIRQCRAEGRPEPDPVPHPDDIRIEDDPPRVVIDGPANAAEKAALDAVVAERDAVQERAAMQAKAYHEAETEEARAAALALWRETMGALDRLDAGLPARYRVGVVERG